MNEGNTSRGQVDPIAVEEYDASLYSPREVVEPLPGMGAITDEHIEQYRELGFIAVADVFDPDQIETARAGLVDLVMGKNESFDDLQFESWAAEKLDRMGLAERELAVRKLMNFVDHEPRLKAMAEHKPLIDLARTLLGGREPKLFQDMALLKCPGGREKPWHQDKAYFDVASDEPVVGFWIALDDSTIENGCMHLIPGSHRDGPIVHFNRRDWQICDTQVGADQVAAPFGPGGVLIFDGLLHHGTPTNRSDQRRRALQFHYAPADAVWEDKAARLAVFGEDGKDVQC